MSACSHREGRSTAKSSPESRPGGWPSWNELLSAELALFRKLWVREHYQHRRGLYWRKIGLVHQHLRHFHTLFGDLAAASDDSERLRKMVDEKSAVKIFVAVKSAIVKAAAVLQEMISRVFFVNFAAILFACFARINSIIDLALKDLKRRGISELGSLNNHQISGKRPSKRPRDWDTSSFDNYNPPSVDLLSDSSEDSSSEGKVQSAITSSLDTNSRNLKEQDTSDLDEMDEIFGGF